MSQGSRLMQKLRFYSTVAYWIQAFLLTLVGPLRVDTVKKGIRLVTGCLGSVIACCPSANCKWMFQQNMLHPKEATAVVTEAAAPPSTTADHKNLLMKKHPYMYMKMVAKTATVATIHFFQDSSMISR